MGGVCVWEEEGRRGEMWCGGGGVWVWGQEWGVGHRSKISGEWAGSSEEECGVREEGSAE